MESKPAFQSDLNLEATELRLGLPGIATETDDSPENSPGLRTNNKRILQNDSAPPPKAQVVGWPPVRSFRKNTLQMKKPATATVADYGGGFFVKVSMDGAPYLRKIDLGLYKGYPELLKALEDMFKFTIGQYSEREGYKGFDFSLTYEDKDGDWMLVGDVPWQMFISSCKRMRIMKGSDGCDV
ncbi:auxin-induced protein 22B-like [Cucurbita maxima]|uniref:Auxin-responsive protein n=1 Tax=Cucurbita maxima TaxID=3661 RepID=A0A6J1L106_CUCMA|nr:auxin-induced protein 22B-like [Cucurbita maxima]